MTHPYPTPAEVDAGCAEILARAAGAELTVTATEDPLYGPHGGVRHTHGYYLRMESPALGTFWCIHQPPPSGRGPVLFHVPGYGAEMSVHPELVAAGYHVVHINPLGYGTPGGLAEAKRPDGSWPVLPDTVLSLGRTGYVDWLAQAAAAVRWVLQKPEIDADRFAFFGSSQGGGGSLLLGSTFCARGCRAVAADVAFLTNHRLVYDGPPETWGAYALACNAINRVRDERPADLEAAWHALGYVDTTSHAHRLAMPVLLTAGLADPTCPPHTIRSLFDVLPGTRSYTELAGQGHAYTTPFLHLARAWFRLYV
jgi:cephalosporin-C deacetylase-like acetyl esterase